MAMPTDDVAKEADYGRLKQGEGGGGEGGEGVRTEIAGQTDNGTNCRTDNGTTGQTQTDTWCENVSSLGVSEQ
jgi:hypothetical protein